MPTLTKPNWVDLPKGYPMGTEAVNEIGQWLDLFFDVFLVRHTSDGDHDDPLIPRGGAFVDFGGATYSLSQSFGIISSVETAPASGAEVRLEFSRAFGTSQYSPIPTPHAQVQVRPSIVDGDTVDFFIRTFAEVATDADFNFVVIGP